MKPIRRAKILAAWIGFKLALWFETHPNFNHAFGPEKLMDLNDPMPDKRAYARNSNKRRAAVKLAMAAGIPFYNQHWQLNSPLIDPTKGTS